MVAMSIVIIPTLPQIQMVLHQESAGPVPHGICHRDEDRGGQEPPPFSPAMSPEGLWEPDGVTAPVHHHLPRGDGAGSGRPGCQHPTPHLGEGDGAGGQGWGVLAAPVPTHGGAHTLQLCT